MSRIKTLPEHNQQKLVPEKEADGLEDRNRGQNTRESEMCKSMEHGYKEQKILTKIKVFYQLS